MALKKAHTEQRIDIRGVDVNALQAAVPDHGRLMDVELNDAAVTQDGTTAPKKRKT